LKNIVVYIKVYFENQDILSKNTII